MASPENEWLRDSVGEITDAYDRISHSGGPFAHMPEELRIQLAIAAAKNAVLERQTAAYMSLTESIELFMAAAAAQSGNN